jgi:hypothetical protein
MNTKLPLVTLKRVTVCILNIVCDLGSLVGPQTTDYGEEAQTN